MRRSKNEGEGRGRSFLSCTSLVRRTLGLVGTGRGRRETGDEGERGQQTASTGAARFKRMCADEQLGQTGCRTDLSAWFVQLLRASAPCTVEGRGAELLRCRLFSHRQRTFSEPPFITSHYQNSVVAALPSLL